MRRGFKPMLFTHLDSFEAVVVDIKEIIGRNNSTIETNPTEVGIKQTAVIELRVDRLFAAETIHDVPKLSRFVILGNRLIAAIGFIRLKVA